MKIGDFSKGTKGNDERFNLEQLYRAPKKLKQENPQILQAPFSNSENTYEMSTSLQRFANVVQLFALDSCPRDSNSPASPPVFTCGCKFVNNVAPTIQLEVKMGKCGPQGPDGLPGIDGQAGERGENGKQGEDGEVGMQWRFKKNKKKENFDYL